MSFDFKTPKPKKSRSTTHIKTNQFPIDIIDNVSNADSITGIFTGMAVEVTNKNDIKRLYSNDFYGVGSQTKSRPKSLMLTHKDLSVIDVNQKRTLDEEKRFDKQNCTEQLANEESLILSLEEAFFLQHSLICLRITDFDQITQINAQDFLNRCCTIKSNFVQSYVAYQYYRARNWIVKSGLKFGGDFLLYYKGPPFYHASYVVMVRDDQSSIGILDMQSNYRVAETANKDIVILEVTMPRNSDGSISVTDIDELKKCTVTEIIPKRLQFNQSAKRSSSSIADNWKRFKQSN